MASKAKKNSKNGSSNLLKQKLIAGDVVVGVVMTMEQPEVAAQMARSGFDFLWIEMEHSPVSLQGLRNMVLATNGTDTVPIARVPNNEIWMPKRVLDMGALGVIFPFTNTPALAKQAVEGCRYPPNGLRGSGADLANARWKPTQGYFDYADENILVVAMIEHIEAVENIDAIAATPGLDVLFVGTSDLSFSMGLRGDMNHPEVEKQVKKVMAAAKRHGKFIGRPARSYKEIQKHGKAGFQFLMSQTDVALLADGARVLLHGK